MTGRERFELWFADPLRELAKQEHKGFILLMVSFPLLERYLRARTMAEPNTERFRRALCNVFPEMPSGKAETFWSTYRHGLLHNVTLSREDHGLTEELPGAVEFRDAHVLINPPVFAERVVSLIESDFSTFEGGKLPLPVAPWYGMASTPGADAPWTLGTGAPSRDRRGK